MNANAPTDIYLEHEQSEAGLQQVEAHYQAIIEQMMVEKERMKEAYDRKVATLT